MPHERGRLLDRAAGVGAERPRREPGGDRSRRAAATSRPGRAPGPTGCASGRRPSSRSTSPSRTRPCSSCRAATGRPPCSAPRRSRRRPGRSPRGSASRPSSRRPCVVITSLSAIGTPVARRLVDGAQVRVQLAVALGDRVEVRGVQLGGGDLAAARAAPSPPRRSGAACRSRPCPPSARERPPRGAREAPPTRYRARRTCLCRICAECATSTGGAASAARGRRRPRARARSRAPARAGATAAARPRPRR